jgi:hypothetical protein
MPWSPKQCRYFETDTAEQKGAPVAKLRGECHDQYRGTKGYGPKTQTLVKRTRSRADA